MCDACACQSHNQIHNRKNDRNNDHGHDHSHVESQKSLIRKRNRILFALLIFFAILIWEGTGTLEQLFGNYTLYAEFILFLIPFFIAGYDVLASAGRNLAKGHGLDENFLMSIATIGAFALVFFPDSEPHMAEGAAVMLFYQVGELFQSYAVGKSRKSISDMMDILPEYANVMRDGKLEKVDPYDVNVGDEFVVRPGEKIPLDGIVISGESRIDTSALTGESVPRTARENDEVISGCVNMSATITVRATKPYQDSTVSRILEMVENAADKKAQTENFITRFARYYTPIVVGLAAMIAILPPLVIGGAWSDWILRGLTFLVVSCPCALVISVPLSFFGGIGGASKMGILIKGSNYLEALSQTDTVVFDKTGTLTSGTFKVTEIHPVEGVSHDQLLDIAAHTEALSTHPIAVSIISENPNNIDMQRITSAEEEGGQGVTAIIDGKIALAGNDRLMYMHDIDFEAHEFIGTQVHVAYDSKYMGTILIGDTLKADSKEAIADLRHVGIKRIVMLTGDHKKVANAVAQDLKIDEVKSELLPQDKVEAVEQILEQDHSGKVAFVGDGINDAPVLMRSDIGIAMGAMGSDAAIEAADIVLMDDKPTQIARAIKVSKRTMRIVWQNIVFALGVKFAVLILAALGIANMWLAVFADVGVAVIAILNAMRCMNSRI